MTGTAPNAATTVRRNGEIGETVVTAVAEAKGVDPLDLEPLYSVVDPDALDAMFRSPADGSPTTVELRFSMEGCQVVIHGDGEVVVTPYGEDDERPTTVAPGED